MEETAANLTFYIPATLAESTPRAASSFTCLETLVARGNTTRSSTIGDAQLVELFGGNSVCGTARAAVSYFAQHGLRDREAWRIIASPVHLLADHTTLHLIHQQQSLLSDEESRALMASCLEYFAEEGWQLDYGDENSWYLHLSHATAVTTTSLEQAAGQPLFEQLPQGDDAKVWRRWINEVQMLLHSHPVNEARRIHGEPIINSLWFWGEGPLPHLPTKRFAHVLGGDRFVQGLAQLSGATWSPLPDGLLSLSAANHHGPTLIVLDEGGGSCWDEEWFCPLLKDRLRSFLKNSVLHFSSGYKTQLDTATRWRLWRRKNFSVHEAGSSS